MPVDGPDSPPQATAEAPPSRRARRVTPDPGIAATAVADPLLAADAAAAERSNGDHPTNDTAPTPVVTTEKPTSTSSSKQRKAAAAKTTTAAERTAVVEVADPPPTEPVDVLLAGAAPADTVTDAVTEAEAPASTTADHATPSNGVPMVALVPPSALAEPPPTAPTPSVIAPTAAALAATAIAPVTAPTPTEPVKGKAQPKPVPPPKSKAVPRRRVRARRVQRIVRRVDAWSVMKISFVFFIVLYLVFLVAGVLLWAFAVGTGTIDNVENFIEQLFALDSFSFVGAQILRASVIGGALLVIAGTFTTTVLAVLFNLISDLVGGVRFTVVEEQVLRPVAPARPPAAAAPSTVDGAPPSAGTV